MGLGAHPFRAAADASEVHCERAIQSGVAAGRLLVVTAALLLAVACVCALPGTAEADEEESSPFRNGLTTTGPTPPRGVLPPAAARAALAGVGEVLLTGAPGYIWHDGCAPTSAGMLLGYYDAHGFPALIAGDASTQTSAVNQVIASHGSAAAPRHYEDYALPRETEDDILRDRSEEPEGDEHPDDCLADFMLTSRSRLGLAYGWSFTSNVGPAVRSYAALADPSSTVTYGDTSIGGTGSRKLTFEVLQAEIDAGRPMVLFVDSNGDGISDHAVLGIGYRETNGRPEYACLDTWYPAVRWATFQDGAARLKFEVFGGTWFVFTPADPTADVSRPVTSLLGEVGGWSKGPVSLTFDAIDQGSGVDRIEAGVDGAPLEPLPGVPAVLSVTGQGTHTVRYRAVDKQGNVEDIRSCTVRVDAQAPATSARAARARRGERVTLRYRVDDLTPKASVRLVVRTLAGRRSATLRPGLRATGELLRTSWRARLPRGTYRVWVYATDQAGNHQVKAGSARLTIR